MSDWWRHFFDEDYMRIYGPEDAGKTDTEVQGLFDLLEPAKGARILDLCCGYGRHALGLAGRGFDVTGFDFSESLLGKARRDCEDQGTAVNLVRGDMRQIPFGTRFDVVINMFTAFGYFETENEDQKVLNEVHRVLVAGGKFLMDTVNRERIMRKFQKESWEELDGDLFALDQREFDPLTSRISARTVVLGEKSRMERHHSLRLYTLTELTQMIEKAGMKLQSVYGHVDGREYWIDTPRIVILATKR